MIFFITSSCFLFLVAYAWYVTLFRGYAEVLSKDISIFLFMNYGIKSKLIKLLYNSKSLKCYVTFFMSIELVLVYLSLETVLN